METLSTTPLLRLLQFLFVAEQVPGIAVTQRRSKNLDVEGLIKPAAGPVMTREVRCLRSITKSIMFERLWHLEITGQCNRVTNDR